MRHVKNNHVKVNLNTLKRLKDIKENKDIVGLSHGIFPGTHCPLFGVSMIASYIEDLVVLVIGTEECTYYSKNFIINRQGINNNFYSLVLDKNDITFGGEKKIKEAIRKINKDVKPEGIMVVSTCVLEVIGEDVHSISDSIKNEIDSKIISVATEHFKCNSHIPGMERALSSLIGLMEDIEEKKEKHINILGYRDKIDSNLELINVLEDNDIIINSIIPSKCKIKTISNLPNASLNIVTDFTAIPLAEEMKKEFNINYVYFPRSLSPEIIKNNYKKIEESLDISIIDKLINKEEKLKELIKIGKEKLSEKTFIYGNTPMMAFEVSSFLCELGMKTDFIQVRELYYGDEEFINNILNMGMNPYICKIANIAPLRYVYNELKPDFYIGHENPMELNRRNIIQSTFDESIKYLGYDLSIYFMEKLINDYEKNKKDIKLFLEMKRKVPHGVL